MFVCVVCVCVCEERGVLRFDSVSLRYILYLNMCVCVFVCVCVRVCQCLKISGARVYQRGAWFRSVRGVGSCFGYVKKEGGVICFGIRLGRLEGEGCCFDMWDILSSWRGGRRIWGGGALICGILFSHHTGIFSSLRPLGHIQDQF